jgi:hypothetical protein
MTAVNGHVFQDLLTQNPRLFDTGDAEDIREGTAESG